MPDMGLVKSEMSFQVALLWVFGVWVRDVSAIVGRAEDVVRIGSGMWVGWKISFLGENFFKTLQTRKGFEEFGPIWKGGASSVQVSAMLGLKAIFRFETSQSIFG